VVYGAARHIATRVDLRTVCSGDALYTVASVADGLGTADRTVFDVFDIADVCRLVARDRVTHGSLWTVAI
jgi:hypothetical protein